MNLREEMNTLEGQVYRDEMMNSDLQVTSVDDVGVFVRDVDHIEEKGDEGGSPYPWDTWKENVDAGRFHLIKEVDRRSEDDDEPESEEEEPEGGSGQDEEESAEEATEEESEKSLNPDDFTHQEARSW